MPISRLMGFAGGARLWKVFWLFGVIPSLLLWAMLLWMVQKGTHAGPTWGLMLVVLLHTIWIVSAVWLAGSNVRELRYGVLAKALTVVWSINAVLLLFFLGLSLLK